MATSTINVVQLMRNTLLANSLVTNLVGSRVMTSHRFDASQTTIDMPVLILAPQGGFAMSNKAKQEQVVHLYSYSKYSFGETLDVYAAAFDALCSERLYDPNVATAGYCYESDRPRTGFNDRLIAWYARGTWIAQAAG